MCVSCVYFWRSGLSLRTSISINWVFRKRRKKFGHGLVASAIVVSAVSILSHSTRSDVPVQPRIASNQIDSNTFNNSIVTVNQSGGSNTLINNFGPPASVHEVKVLKSNVPNGNGFTTEFDVKVYRDVWRDVNVCKIHSAIQPQLESDVVKRFAAY